MGSEGGGGAEAGGQGGFRRVGLANAVEVRDVIGRNPGQGKRFV